MHKEKVASFINSSEYSPMTKENIAILMCVPASDMNEFNAVIDELISEGIIIIGKKGRCFSTKSMGLIEGVFRSSSKGFGFVSDEKGDIHIPVEALGGALNGDRVLVKIQKSAKGQKHQCKR